MLNVDSFYVAFTIAREAAIQFKSAHSLRKFKFTSRFGERIFFLANKKQLPEVQKHWCQKFAPMVIFEQCI